MALRCPPDDIALFEDPRKSNRLGRFGGAPEVVLLAVHFDEDFVDEKGITIPPVSSPHTARVDRSEFYAPKPRFLCSKRCPAQRGKTKKPNAPLAGQVLPRPLARYY